MSYELAPDSLRRSTDPDRGSSNATETDFAAPLNHYQARLDRSFSDREWSVDPIGPPGQRSSSTSWVQAMRIVGS